MASGLIVVVMPVSLPAFSCTFHTGQASANTMTTIPFNIVGFDLDGTLLDTAADLGEALNHALALAGRPRVASGEVRNLIGGGAKQMLTRALSITGGPLPDDELRDLHAALIAYYTDHIAVHSRLFPGGEAMLDGLARRGVGLAVVTNKLESLAVKLLADLGLTERFFTIIGGDTLGPGAAKPKPDLIELMLERAPHAVTRAAYIGDTSFDSGAAKAAGLPCVIVSFGFCDAPPHDLSPHVIDHYDQLIPTLAQL